MILHQNNCSAGPDTSVDTACNHPSENQNYESKARKDFNNNGLGAPEECYQVRFNNTRGFTDHDEGLDRKDVDAGTDEYRSYQQGEFLDG